MVYHESGPTKSANFVDSVISDGETSLPKLDLQRWTGFAGAVEGSMANNLSASSRRSAAGTSWLKRAVPTAELQDTYHEL